MFEALVTSPLFSLTITCFAWSFGVWTQKKSGLLICNPLVITTALLIGFLVLLQIPYSTYMIGGNFISTMLGPVTSVLALNIYNHRKLLGRYFFPVLAGCLVGSLTSILSVSFLCKLFLVDSVVTASLLPKSVTTAIAVAISESRGGVAGVTSAAVLIVGTVGAIFAPTFAKLFHVKDPVAEGIAIGASSHALGTAKALEIGELQGAMSSIAICVCGIMTSVLVLFIH